MNTHYKPVGSKQTHLSHVMMPSVTSAGGAELVLSTTVFLSQLTIRVCESICDIQSQCSKAVGQQWCHIWQHEWWRGRWKRMRHQSYKAPSHTLPFIFVIPKLYGRDWHRGWGESYISVTAHTYVGEWSAQTPNSPALMLKGSYLKEELKMEQKKKNGREDK